MKVFGSYGLGAVLKVMLEIALVLGILVLFGMPYLLKFINEKFDLYWLIVMPCGLLFLVIVWEFIGMFKTLEKKDPFSLDNVKRLNKSKYAS